MSQDPSLLLVAVLLGIAVLMTGIIYLAFIKLLRLPFVLAGLRRFHLPLVIGATALFKVSHLLSQWPQAARLCRAAPSAGLSGAGGGHPGGGLRGPCVT